MADENTPVTPQEGGEVAMRIEPVGLETEMQRSYLDYAMSVIVSRALPDVRDARPDCPAPVAAFLAGALSPETAHRPASAADVRTRLRELRRSLDTAR